jgi:flagellar biosynthesis protein FliQ
MAHHPTLILCVVSELARLAAAMHLPLFPLWRVLAIPAFLARKVVGEVTLSYLPYLAIVLAFAITVDWLFARMMDWAGS